jgi:hypothetical protein
MDTWGGYYNILQVGPNVFLLCESVTEVEAENFLSHYRRGYPNAEFKVVQVDFAHPRWWQPGIGGMKVRGEA